MNTTQKKTFTLLLKYASLGAVLTCSACAVYEPEPGVAYESPNPYYYEYPPYYGAPPAEFSFGFDGGGRDYDGGDHDHGGGRR